MSDTGEGVICDFGTYSPPSFLRRYLTPMLSNRAVKGCQRSRNRVGIHYHFRTWYACLHGSRALRRRSGMDSPHGRLCIRRDMSPGKFLISTLPFAVSDYYSRYSRDRARFTACAKVQCSEQLLAVNTRSDLIHSQMTISSGLCSVAAGASTRNNDQP